MRVNMLKLAIVDCIELYTLITHKKVNNNVEHKSDIELEK